MDRDEIIRGLNCIAGIDESNSCKGCPYYESGEECDEDTARDAVSLLEEDRKLIDALIELGYPHNFQNEAPHIANYCWAISEIITKAFKLENGRR